MARANSPPSCARAIAIRPSEHHEDRRSDLQDPRDPRRRRPAYADLSTSRSFSRPSPTRIPYRPPTLPSPPPDKLTKKQLTADHPTWCPGCGDFAVLASFFKVLEKLQIPHEKIVTIAGIGCSSRFPYFVNRHGLHFIHGRALPLATGVSLSRPDYTSSSLVETAMVSRSVATTWSMPLARTSISLTSSWTTTSMV